MTRRRLGPVLAGVMIIAVGLLAFAAPAFAHAQLLGTSPASGVVLASPPGQVVLTFGEPVEAAPDAIEVFGANGHQVRTGPVGHPGGRGEQVGVTLPSATKGTYVVSWRVISADTHPVQGAFTFSVGAPSAGAGVGSLEQHLLASRHPSRTLGVLTGALRTVILLAVIVAVGGASLLVAWPMGVRVRTVRNSIVAAASVAAVATVAAVLAQGPYDAGRALGDAFQSNVLSPVLHSSFGTGAGLRIAGALVMLVGIGAVGRSGRDAEPTHGSGEAAIGAGLAPGAGPPPGEGSDAKTGVGVPAGARPGDRTGRSGLAGVPAWLLATLVGAAALVVSLSLSGHAVTGRWEPLGFIADLVHVSAAAVWVGGLLVLATVLLRTRPGIEPDELEGVVRRFSATAVVAVAAIVGSGVFQAWRQVGSWNQLTETDYGTVLLLKVTLMVAAVEAGWFSRRWVNSRFQPVGATGPEAGETVSEVAVAEGARTTAAGPGRGPGPGPGPAALAVRPGPDPGAAAAAGDHPGARGLPRPALADPAGAVRSGGRGPTASRFRRWLAFEAAIGIGIVALTGVLVDTVPPQGERVAATARAYTGRTLVARDYLLSVAVYPLVPGTVHVAIQLTNRATVPVDAFQVTAQMRLPARNIGPLAVTLQRQATGSWVGETELPLPGRWQLMVAVLTDPITQIDRAFNFTIYG